MGAAYDVTGTGFIIGFACLFDLMDVGEYLQCEKYSYTLLYLILDMLPYYIVIFNLNSCSKSTISVVSIICQVFSKPIMLGSLPSN